MSYETKWQQYETVEEETVWWKIELTEKYGSIMSKTTMSLIDSESAFPSW